MSHRRRNVVFLRSVTQMCLPVDVENNGVGCDICTCRLADFTLLYSTPATRHASCICIMETPVCSSFDWLPDLHIRLSRPRCIREIFAFEPNLPRDVSSVYLN